MTLMIDDNHLAYCREARRLRWVYAHRPARMLREIADLSTKYNSLSKSPAAQAKSPAPAQSPPPIAVQAVRASPRPIFAEKVSAELSGDVLTYSKRQALLDEAQRMGIGRFEANLVIAEEQHRTRPVAASTREIPAARRFPLRLLGVLLAVEALTAVVLFHFFIK